MRPKTPLCGSLCPIRALVFSTRRHECLLDAALRLVLLTGDALGVDPQQHVHAVARPLGDLRSGHPRVEPGGYRRVAEVVGAPGQQRSGFAGGGRASSDSGTVPVLSQCTTAARSTGGSGAPRSRSLNAQVRSARRISSTRWGISPVASKASVASVSASAMDLRWLGAAWSHLAAV
jgi:hypothetical protein